MPSLPNNCDESHWDSVLVWPASCSMLHYVRPPNIAAVRCSDMTWSTSFLWSFCVKATCEIERMLLPPAAALPLTDWQVWLKLPARRQLSILRPSWPVDTWPACCGPFARAASERARQINKWHVRRCQASTWLESQHAAKAPEGGLWLTLGFQWSLRMQQENNWTERELSFVRLKNDQFLERVHLLFFPLISKDLLNCVISHSEVFNVRSGMIRHTARNVAASFIISKKMYSSFWKGLNVPHCHSCHYFRVPNAKQTSAMTCNVHFSNALLTKNISYRRHASCVCRLLFWIWCSASTCLFLSLFSCESKKTHQLIKR